MHPTPSSSDILRPRYGWATFIAGNRPFIKFLEPSTHPNSMAAGGGAYYFAKRSVNADRTARHEEIMKRQRIYDNPRSNEARDAAVQPKKEKEQAENSRKKPNQETPAILDTNPAPETDDSINKFVPAKPYRSRKGDRFS